MVFRYNIRVGSFDKESNINKSTSLKKDIKRLTPANKKFLSSLGFKLLKTKLVHD